MNQDKTYIAIDLKSFYASVECCELGLNPLDTLLVVADEKRTDKTICLAVSPALKSFNIPGRPRLFEVKQQVNYINKIRKQKSPAKQFAGASHFLTELNNHPELQLNFIIAPPRMAHYIDYSAQIYGIYTKYVSPNHIIVYSIDEVFIDITAYLKTYRQTAKELTTTILLDILNTTGITATAGIGTNLFLAKVAMDIVAKHIPTDEYGVRIAELNEQTYRETLWHHRPLTDFWRVGKGYASKLEAFGIYTMGDVAKCSHTNEELLYKLFGKNAELLIDHAWGWEPCTIDAIKAYRPSANSLSSGQVLHAPYEANDAKLVLKEMADQLALDLVSKHLVTNQIVVTIGYDKDNLSDPERSRYYHGPIHIDSYGKKIPAHSHGTHNLKEFTSSSKVILRATEALANQLIDSRLLVRRLNIVATHVIPESLLAHLPKPPEQLELFTDYEEQKEQEAQEKKFLKRERAMQETLIHIKNKFGKNSILRGMNLEKNATGKDRNNQIGGHQA